MKKIMIIAFSLIFVGCGQFGKNSISEDEDSNTPIVCTSESYASGGIYTNSNLFASNTFWYGAAIDSKCRMLAGGYQDDGSEKLYSVVRLDQNGNLDSTFGDGGVKLIDDGSSYHYGRALDVQSDDKVILAGSSGEDFGILRLTAEGDLDTTFGSNGVVKVSFGSGTDGAYAVKVLSNGYIVAGGRVHNGSNYDFGLVLLDSRGNVLVTVTTDFANGQDEVRALAETSDGKIIAGGFCHNGSNNDFCAARYTAAGVLDTSFAYSGKASVDFASGNDNAYGLAVDPNNKILLVGSSGGKMGMVMLNANGSVDTTFGDNGRKTVGDSGEAKSVVRASNGTYYISGRLITDGDSNYGVIQLTSSGTLNTDFGSLGLVETNIYSNALDISETVLLQDDGKIIAVGFSQPSGYAFTAVRYESSGKLDN